MTWDAANSWASSLTVGGFNDWRLPLTLPVGATLGGVFTLFSNNGTSDFGYAGTASEMGHLYYTTLGNLGAYIPNDAQPQGTVPQPGAGLGNTGPFSGLQSFQCWSATEFEITGYAWEFDVRDGAQGFIDKRAELYALAVRPGDVTAAIPEPQTYALLLGGLATMWVVRRRRAY